MSAIPEWQYPLYEAADRLAYSTLEKIGKSQSYPKLIGSAGEINEFLTLLILSQKMKEYRIFRDITLGEFEKDRVDIPNILDEGKSLQIPRGVDESWAVFTQDKRLCELTDHFRDSRTEFQGTNDEIVEFVIRFLLSQLLMDWRGPLMAVLLECTKKHNVQISKLNDLLKNWDHTGIFKTAAP